VSLSYEDVAEILKIIDSSSCDEVIVETGDVKLVVRRNTAPGYVAPAAERAGPGPAIAALPRSNATTARQATTGQVMKLFTTINSECAGRVVQIGAETGDLVEYGHTLFVIEPAN
jgi:hypothetical protein